MLSSTEEGKLSAANLEEEELQEETKELVSLMSVEDNPLELVFLSFDNSSWRILFSSSKKVFLAISCSIYCFLLALEALADSLFKSFLLFKAQELL